MLPPTLWLLCLAAIGAGAQGDSSTSASTLSSSSSSSTTSSRSSSTTNYNAGDGQTSLSFTNSLSTITGSFSTDAFTGSQYVYVSPTGQITRTFTQTVSANGTIETVTSTSTGASNSQITATTSSVSLTVIGGGSATSSTKNTTASSTSSSARPSNTLPCNGFPEFCNRKYSNITNVVSHNSAFVVKNNAASNQVYPIVDQLNDGVRMLQGEVHWVNGTMWNCHSSCDLLNAGTWQSELEVAKQWLDENPYEVLSFLIVNSVFTNVENFVTAITNSGLLEYAYEPEYVPQYRDQWPTLGEMILKNQRMVFFMDYDANQTAVPYILDEFTHIWETPFSPTNRSFPCTQQRPPGLNQTEARDKYMYLANHNLNTPVDLSSLGINTGMEQILIPNTADINITNGLYNQYSQAGATVANCTADWGRPPQWLLVDYYNFGTPMAGSVFHVAAQANGVTYTLDCCGKDSSSATNVRTSFIGLAVAVFVTAFLVSI